MPDVGVMSGEIVGHGAPDRFPLPAPARSVPAGSGGKAARSGETGEGDEVSLREVYVNEMYGGSREVR